MLKSYEVRVRATYDLVVATLDYINAHPGTLRKAVHAGRRRHDRAREGGVEIAARVQDDRQADHVRRSRATRSRSRRATSPATPGSPTIRKTPKTYEIPFYRDLVATDSVRLPAAYVVPAAWPQIIEKLAQHGIRFERLAHDATLDVERYRLDESGLGRQAVRRPPPAARCRDRDRNRRVEVPAGSVIVPMDQPAANVVANLLEPRAPDSLLRWGFLDACFEQKESPDARVAETARARHDREGSGAEGRVRRESRRRSRVREGSVGARSRSFTNARRGIATQHVGVYPVLRLDAAALAAAEPASRPPRAKAGLTASDRAPDRTSARAGLRRER